MKKLPEKITSYNNYDKDIERLAWTINELIEYLKELDAINKKLNQRTGE